MKYDYLIVGAGLFGSVFAEHAKRFGKKVLVIDQRSHIGGNCYTENIDGINVHKYGPHIFHTSNEKVWEYINRFVSFNHYTHRVKAFYNKKIYSLPINLLTLNQLWGVVTPNEALNKLELSREKIDDPKNMEEWCLKNLGSEIYETFFKGYTTKQWRRDPKELPPSIIKRLPVRFTYDDNYFNDKYQGIPIGGYTQIFEKMLDGVEVKLNTSFEANWRKYAKKLVFTGRLDELFNYKYGELSYLTLRFEEKKVEGDYQGVAQLNYTSSEIPYTRCIEHKHMEFGNQNFSIITHEYPIDWHKDAIPYYPVPTKESTLLHEKYLNELDPSLILGGGRLFNHIYLDMHQVIASSMNLAKKEFSND